MQRPANLDDFWKTVQHELMRGARQARHDFHSPVIGSTGRDGQAELRTVVFRDYDADRCTLTFHTDARSQKIEELAADPRLTWLFYSRRTRLQVRISSRAEIHEDGPLVDQHWAGQRDGSRRVYATSTSPGSVVERPVTPVERPAGLTDEERSDARRHFRVITAQAESIEALLLDREGHLRARWWAWPPEAESRLGSWLEP